MDSFIFMLSSPQQTGTVSTLQMQHWSVCQSPVRFTCERDPEILKLFHLAQQLISHPEWALHPGSEEIIFILIASNSAANHPSASWRSSPDEANGTTASIKNRYEMVNRLILIQHFSTLLEHSKHLRSSGHKTGDFPMLAYTQKSIKIRNRRQRTALAVKLRSGLNPTYRIIGDMDQALTVLQKNWTACNNKHDNSHPNGSIDGFLTCSVFLPVLWIVFYFILIVCFGFYSSVWISWLLSPVSHSPVLVPLR